jgi:hypothetical protein
MTANLKETSKLRALEEKICREKQLSHDTLRRLLSKVEEYSESHRAQGLPDDLYRILNDELNEKENQEKELASAEE